LARVNLLENLDLHLKENKTQGAGVRPIGEGSWRLEIPAGAKGPYRLAQLDDYGGLARVDFPHRPPFRLRLQARASSRQIPGTWGFGLWNNPFGMAILRGAELLRLPALPQAAWFFHASPENYLALRDDLPANGLLAGTFHSRRVPSGLFVLGAPALPLVLVRPAVRLARRLGRLLVRQDSVRPEIDVTEWHDYEIDWEAERATFRVDGKTVLETPASPLGPLGLVLWVDNQYAALRPEGQVSFGTLANPEAAWVEIRVIADNR
jgi:hypothetical protein